MLFPLILVYIEWAISPQINFEDKIQLHSTSCNSESTWQTVCKSHGHRAHSPAHSRSFLERWCCPLSVTTLSPPTPPPTTRRTTAHHNCPTTPLVMSPSPPPMPLLPFYTTSIPSAPMPLDVTNDGEHPPP